MRREGYALTAVLLGILILTTGCTTKKRHQRDIANLQSQIGTLQSEIARLDQQLRDTEIALKAAKEQAAVPTAGLAGDSVFAKSGSSGIYRTPSGFELPSAAIQRALKNAGYYQGAIDGKVGSLTRDAIRSFQRDQGLVVDGICGRQTWDRLKSFSGGVA